MNKEAISGEERPSTEIKNTKRGEVVGDFLPTFYFVTFLFRFLSSC
jgi:hypothetical protein